jgi:hypothetical protein
VKNRQWVQDTYGDSAYVDRDLGTRRIYLAVHEGSNKAQLSLTVEQARQLADDIINAANDVYVHTNIKWTNIKGD